MDSPKISVIVPSYNKVRFISQTLESIVSQEYSNYEVIIQDGGSTDGTLEIIKRFVKKYPKEIYWQSKKDKGQLDAINMGYSKAGGDILTFINADDIYLPNTFGIISKLYSSNPDSLWFAGKGIVIDSKGKEIAKFATWYKNLLLSLNSEFLLLVTNYLMQPSVFITRKAWGKYGLFTGTPGFVTEYDMWLRIAKDRMPVISDKYFSGFRIEPSTITKTNTNKLLLEDEKIVRKYTKNPVIVFLHTLHNWGRRVVGEIV